MCVVVCSLYTFGFLFILAFFEEVDIMLILVFSD